MQISQGDYSVLVTRPISATILALAMAAVAGPPVWRLFKRG